MRELFNTLLRLLFLVWHHAYVFFTKSRSFPPIALWIFILYLNFDTNNPPVNTFYGYMSIMPWLFFIMVWFGYLFLSSLGMVEEHILILQINSRFFNALSKVLFLLAISMIISLLGCIFPVIIHFFYILIGLNYIPGGLSLTEFFFALILSNIIGALGVSLAYLFQPNPSKQHNKFTSGTLIIFALLAIAKEQILTLQDPFHYFLFIFTPLIDILSLFYNSNMFVAEDLVLSAIYGGIYCLTAMIIGYWLYDRRLYGPLIAQCKKNNGLGLGIKD